MRLCRFAMRKGSALSAKLPEYRPPPRRRKAISSGGTGDVVNEVARRKGKESVKKSGRRGGPLPPLGNHEGCPYAVTADFNFFTPSKPFRIARGEAANGTVQSAA